MPFKPTLSKLLHTLATVSVLLAIWRNLPPEWRADVLDAVEGTTWDGLRATALAVLRAAQRALET